MRTIAELRATGAAWITESELEWLCEQLEAAQKMEQQLHEEIDELAISLMDESDVVVSQANGYRDVLRVVAERTKELQEQFEAQAAALRRISQICPKPLRNGNANYLEDAQSAEIHRLCEASSPASDGENLAARVQQAQHLIIDKGDEVELIAWMLGRPVEDVRRVVSSPSREPDEPMTTERDESQIKEYPIPYPACKPDVSEPLAHSPSPQGVRRPGRGGPLPGAFSLGTSDLAGSETSDPAKERQ